MAFSCFINPSLFDFSSKPSKEGEELGRCCVTLFIFPFLNPTINILSIIIACEGMMACTLDCQVCLAQLDITLVIMKYYSPRCLLISNTNQFDNI